MEANPGWTKMCFTSRSPKGVLSPEGLLIKAGSYPLLLILFLEGTYHPGSVSV